MSQPSEILILVSKLNNRVYFLLRHVFNRMIGIRPIITNDKEAYMACQGPKINYTPNNLNDGIHIIPEGILYEKGIRKIEPEIGSWRNIKTLFHNTGIHIPFDLFGAIFYLITRYEEYTPKKLDKHGRYNHTESIAYREGFLEIPIVDLWVDELKKTIAQLYPNTIFVQRQFEYIVTVDVDSAYAYQHKGLFRVLAASVRDIIKLDFTTLFNRIASLIGVIHDPYNNFDYIKEQVKDQKHKPIFFILSGKYGQYDKNLNIRGYIMQRLLTSIKQYASIGLHPSYASNKKRKLIGNEKNAIEANLGHHVHKTRQHYIILQFPKTYQNLVKFEFAEDYSMGYPTINGFRSSTCTPYNFFDLTKEVENSLKIIPFQAMDTTFTTYLKQTPDEALQTFLRLLEITKSVNGTFVSLWHNESFGTDKIGLNWRNTFETVINEAKNN